MSSATKTKCDQIRELAAGLPFEERRAIGREIARATRDELRALARAAAEARWSARDGEGVAA